MLAPLVILGMFAAQTPRPLDKVEVIRLLTNPLFAQSEIADVVRRSCLAFRPTERDWADFRNAGASGEVIASVAACTTRGTARTASARVAPQPRAPAVPPAPPPEPPPPPAPLTAVATTPDIAVSAGVPSSARIFVHRGGVPQRRVPVTLRGTTSLGLSRDATGVTDDSGMVVFPLPPVTQPGTHRFEVVGNNGVSFPGRPMVTLGIRAGEPGRLRVTPDYITSVENGATVVATVTDSLGNPLVRETVELSSGVGAPVTTATDSLGRATFALAAGALPRGGALQVRVRKLAAVEVPVADAAGLSNAATGFGAPTPRRGRVGGAPFEPVVFSARTVQGQAPIGRVVRFRAVNARVTPDSAVLDSTGRVPLDVVLGARAGEALVFASIGSVEKLVTFQAEPGPIASLIVEHNGRDVTGKSVSVRVAAPFVLRVTAQDFYGNATSVDALAQMLRNSLPRLATSRQRDIEIIGVESSDTAVLITLQAPRLGMYNLTIGGGITARVRVDAVAR